MPTYNSRGLPLYSTGETFPGWASAFNSQSNLLATALDDADTANQNDDSVALVADLPISGNWLGRRIYVQEDQSLRLCTTLPGTFEMIGRIGEWSTYTPAWNGTILNPSIGNGVLNGRWQPLSSNTIALHIELWFGSTTSGGTGYWTFGLPSGFMSAPVGEQMLVSKAFVDVQSINYVGAGYVPDSSTVLHVLMPVSSATSAMTEIQNADVTVAVGTGVPAVPGSYTFTDGSNLMISGVFEVA